MDALPYRAALYPACHAGAASCFYQGQVLEPEPSPWILTELMTCAEPHGGATGR